MTANLQERQIVVPGSSANLGPGLDTLSVAVQLYLRVRIVEVLPSRPHVFDTVFVHGPVTGENRVETAFRAACLQNGHAVPRHTARIGNTARFITQDYTVWALALLIHYFLTWRSSIWRRTTAPYTFPRASTPTPSAPE